MKTNLLIVFLGILFASLIFGGYKYYVLSQEYEANKLTNEGVITELRATLDTVQLEKTSLSDALTAEQNKNEEFEEQIEDLFGTVGALTKLSKTDPELLKKYSKVYFLNENYVPPKLSDISSDALFDTSKPQKFLTEALPFLKRLLADAKRDGIDLKIISAYRSFDTQATLKSNYKFIYGAGTANQFSADQGYSEHQLGTAIDFTNSTVGGALNSFENTPEHTWLVENAYKFGFILSYPSGNQYYQYEPWHWRFVGIDLAGKLHDQNKKFYDLDQNQIDSFLIKIFDR